MFIGATIPLLVASSAAKADFTTGLIDVDFKFTTLFPPQTGPAVIGSAGDVWNTELNPSPHTSAILNLSSGTTSNGVMYSLSGFTGAVITGTRFIDDGFSVGAGNTSTITLAGLTAFQPYDLYLYSGVSEQEVRTTTFTIAGSSLTSTIAVVPPTVGFIEGTNYVRFLAQPADFSGQIAITVQGAGGSSQDGSSNMGGLVSGFQVTPVPEPATIFLIAVAGCCVALAKPPQPRSAACSVANETCSFMAEL